MTTGKGLRVGTEKIYFLYQFRLIDRLLRELTSKSTLFVIKTLQNALITNLTQAILKASKFNDDAPTISTISINELTRFK